MVWQEKVLSFLGREYILTWEKLLCKETKTRKN